MIKFDVSESLALSFTIIQPCIPLPSYSYYRIKRVNGLQITIINEMTNNLNSNLLIIFETQISMMIKGRHLWPQ